VAITFATLLNVGLWASFVRYDTVSVTWRLGAWVSLAIFWAGGLWQGAQRAEKRGQVHLMRQTERRGMRAIWQQAFMTLLPRA